MNSAPIGARRRGAHTSPSPTIPSPPSSDLQAAQAKAAGEIASLVKLAELDAEQLDREGVRRAPANDALERERHRLTAKLSSEILDAYDRSLRAGRRPAVVRLAANVCSGCNVRLHSTLEQKVRKRRGFGACPHCLRLVYDPAWLHGDDPL